MIFLSKLLACAIFLAQAPFAYAESQTDTATEAEPRKLTTTIKLLHKNGKANYLRIDDSLGVVFFPVRINGKVTWAMLDNGVSNTTVDTNFAKKIGLKVRATDKIIRASFSNNKQYIAENVLIEVPGQFRATSGLDISAADLSGISKTLDRKIGLFLGLDILKSLSFVLDSKNNSILFAGPGKINPKGVEGMTWLNMKDGIFSGTINGKEAKFKIDLGSSSKLFVYEQSWNKFFGDMQTQVVSRSTDLSGEVFNVQGIPNVNVNIEIFDMKATAKKTPFRDDSVDAMVGFPLFKDRVTIFDFSKDKVIVSH